MTIILIIFHVLICLALVLIVLLQTGKGSDLASAFGGGGQNAMFGGAGPASFLNKMTTAVAVLFMATSFTLAYVSSGSETIMDDQPAVTEQAADDETADEGNTTETVNEDVDTGAAPAADVAPADDAAAGDTESAENDVQTDSETRE
ncbi:MAG TPA: preprotein translocase subunit SecG [bacterium]|nr:preprotein translocase subunit SecG [bacterium]